MRNEITAVIERDGKCMSRLPRNLRDEWPGQNETEPRKSLAEAIALDLGGPAPGRTAGDPAERDT